jgi:hypothetical protein
MDNEDWESLEELINQAGGVASTPNVVPDSVRADAMSFHTLGLAILDIQTRLAGLESASNKPVFYGPYGEKLG